MCLLGTWSTGSGPLYRQLAASIALLIDEGALRDGVVLPPERALASALSVSRSTVVSTFGHLAADGRVVRRQGSGTQVIATQMPGPQHLELRSAPMFDRGSETRALLQAVPPAIVDLPAELQRLATETGTRGHEAFLHDVEPEGMWELRAAIAQRFTAKGLPTEPTEVLITS